MYVRKAFVMEDSADVLAALLIVTPGLADISPRTVAAPDGRIEASGGPPPKQER